MEALLVGGAALLVFLPGVFQTELDAPSQEGPSREAEAIPVTLPAPPGHQQGRGLSRLCLALRGLGG